MAYKFNPFTGNFDEVGTSGGSGNPLEIEYRTITAPEDAAKQITLVAAPLNVTKVQMGVRGGGTQILGTDFTVSGSTLSWNGLGLDGILSTGDQITILYET